MNRRRTPALCAAAALLALGACMAPSPSPDNGKGGTIPAPQARSATSTLLTRDCNANGVMDLFEVQHKRFDFSPAATYDTGYNNDALAAGDLDGDGDTDVAAANAEASSVSILLNNGSGVLSLDREASISLAATPLRIAVGQFNADARLDMAVLFRENDVAVFLNSGEGPPRFTLSATYRLADDAISSGDWTNVDFVVADFDSDGRADIAALITDLPAIARRVALLWSNGDGSLSAPQRTSQLRPQMVNSLTALDIDRDGHLDLAIGSAEVGIALVRNQGARVLDYRSARHDLHYGVSGIGLSVGDLNDDGYAELLVRHAENRASVLVNTSAGGTMGFDREGVLSIVLARAASTLTAAEVDGDGLPDLLASG